MIRREGSVFVVEGPVTMANVEAVLAEGERLFDGSELQVDLAGVTEVDSSAVSLLLDHMGDRGPVIEETLIGHLVARESTGPPRPVARTEE